MPLTAANGMTSMRVGQPHGKYGLNLSSPWIGEAFDGAGGRRIHGTAAESVLEVLLFANRLPPSNGDQPASPNTNGNDCPRNVSKTLQS